MNPDPRAVCWQWYGCFMCPEVYHSPGAGPPAPCGIRANKGEELARKV